MTSIYTLIRSRTTNLHLIRRRTTTCYPESRLDYYEMDPNFGSGTCTVFSERGMIFILTDLVLLNERSCLIQKDELCTIGCFPGIEMRAETKSASCLLEKGDIFSSIYLKENLRITVPKKFPLKGMILIFSKKIADTLIQKFPTPEQSKENDSISALSAALHVFQQEHIHSECTSVLAQLYHFQGSDSARIFFFSSKMNELIAILFSSVSQSNHPETSFYPVSDEDRIHIEQLIQYLKDHPDQNLKLEEMAALSCMSLSKLKYTFKAVTGSSAGEFQNQNRLRQAALLLKTSDQAIGEIAKKTGFHSSSYFSSQFRKQTGISPRQYREKYKSDLPFSESSFCQK